MALDVIMIILLPVTIFYCWKLNQRMQELRKDQTKFHEMISGLDKAILTAESSISHLKEISNTALNTMQNKIDAANSIANDLEFLTDRAINNIKKLDESFENVNLPEKKENHIDEVINNVQTSPGNQNNKTQAIEDILNRISKIRNNQKSEKSDFKKTKLKEYS